ncbi:hypothetical protein GF367_03115 [Candidatus Woesearchaeota archaeon]|nr:hypothetical protein [Candidatus Woesearchaeota archaeon]
MNEDIDLGKQGTFPYARIEQLFKDNFEKKDEIKILSKEDITILAVTYVQDSVMNFNARLDWIERQTGTRPEPRSAHEVIDEAVEKTLQLYDFYMNIPLSNLYANRVNFGIKTQDSFGTYELKLQFGGDRTIAFNVADPAIGLFPSNPSWGEEELGSLNYARDAFITDDIKIITPDDLAKRIYKFWEEAHQEATAVEQLTHWQEIMQEKPRFFVTNEETGEAYHTKYALAKAVEEILLFSNK